MTDPLRDTSTKAVDPSVFDAAVARGGELYHHASERFNGYRSDIENADAERRVRGALSHWIDDLVTRAATLDSVLNMVGQECVEGGLTSEHCDDLTTAQDAVSRCLYEIAKSRARLDGWEARRAR